MGSSNLQDSSAPLTDAVIKSLTDRSEAYINPKGHRWSIVYDDAARVAANINPLGYRTTNVYNIASQALATINANGNRVSNVYDALGRRSVEINANGGRTTTVFDAVGQTSALVDARGNRNSFTYDSTGAQTQLIDPLNRRTTSAYDAAGQQSLRIDARGNRTSFAYSTVGQLASRKYPDGSRATLSYDTVGNRTVMADSTGWYTNVYDAVGQTTVTASPNSQRQTSSYDSVGLRRSMDATGAGRFTYQYDAASQLSSLLNPYTERTSFAYDDAGRRNVQRNANGTRVSLSYDAASQTTQVFHRTSAGASVLQLDYRYDPAGNRKSMIENVSAARTSWTYDKQNQLLGEHRTGTNAYRQTFTYDAAGNRTLKNIDTVRTTYAYDVANQLKYGQAVAGRTSFAYDATGNQRIEQPPAGNRTTTTWNYENQPTQYRLSAGSPVTMTYNGDNRRVISQQGATSTKFVWDAATDAYLSELNAANAVQAVYTNEPQHYGSVVSQRRSSTSHWLHADALGTIRRLTSSTQTTTDSYPLDAWGNPITSSGTTVNPFRWVGRYGYYQDSSTGLVYARARMYQPTIARWCSVDPFLFGRDYYRYCDQNPLRRIDPNGLVWTKIGGDNSTIYRASSEEDSLYGLAFEITRDTRDWVCIWPKPNRLLWQFYPWAKCNARADVKNLVAKDGHILLMRAPTVQGENGYLRALYELFRVGAYVWQPGLLAGRDAAARFARESQQGGLPIDVLGIAGHGYGDNKICSGAPGAGPHQNCFSADDVFKEAFEKFNDQNTYRHAIRQIGPPRCWLTKSAVVHSVACNTASVWAQDWAKRIARPGATVKGAPSIIMAEYNGNGNARAWFTAFPDDKYNTADDFINSNHWVDVEGDA